MSLPTPQEARSRQTAYEVERHWWVQRVEELRRRTQHRANVRNDIGIREELEEVCDWLSNMLAERTK